MNLTSSVPSAVVDTNVIIEISTIADLERECGSSCLQRYEQRREKAKESMAMALCFHCEKTTTLSLGGELDRKLDELAPNDADGSLFPSMFGHFLMDYIFTGWKPRCLSSDSEVKGNDVDRMLVDCAAEYNIPMITRETNEENVLRTHARRRKVELLSPRDWIIRRGRSVRVLLNELYTRIVQEMEQYKCDKKRSFSERGRFPPEKERNFDENCAYYLSAMECILH